MDFKRLLSYTASASAFLIGSEVSAQIMHSDLNPDITLDALTMTADGLGQFALDIDSNGVDDFIFKAEVSSTASGKWEFVRVDRGDLDNEMPWPEFPGPNPYSAGQQIDSALPFLDADVRLIQQFQWSSTSINSSTTVGNWQGAVDAFLPIKFKIDANFHFGYIRMGVLDYDSFEIKAYAYEATPGDPIKAGALPPPPVISAIESPVEALEGADIWFADEGIHYRLPSDIFAGPGQPLLKVVDLNGKIVATQSINSTTGEVPFRNNGIHIAVISHGTEQRAIKLSN